MSSLIIRPSFSASIKSDQATELWSTAEELSGQSWRSRSCDQDQDGGFFSALRSTRFKHCYSSQNICSLGNGKAGKPTEDDSDPCFRVVVLYVVVLCTWLAGPKTVYFLSYLL